MFSHLLERSLPVVANVLDYDIVVIEFEHQSRYYVHFRTNNLGKDIPTSYGLNSTLVEVPLV